MPRPRKPTEPAAKPAAKTPARRHSTAWKAAQARKLSPKEKASRAKRRIPKEVRAQMEAAREAEKAERAKDALIYVNLSTFHIIGGMRYGPGVCYVPRRVAPALMEQDGRARKAEAQLFNTRTAIIGNSGRGSGVSFMNVAPQHFEAMWSGPYSQIFDQVSGRGMNAGEGARF